jgi:hypothetical protein
VLAVNRDAGGRLVRTSLDGVPSAAVATDADLGLLADGLLALAGHGRPAVGGTGAGGAGDRRGRRPGARRAGSPGPSTAETAISLRAPPPARPHLTAWRLGARAASTARPPSSGLRAAGAAPPVRIRCAAARRRAWPARRGRSSR